MFFVIFVTESPLPISFNASEINKLTELIDDDIFQTSESFNYVANSVNNTSLSTAHPSPDCSINHLDFDCDNHFCPYYVEKENEFPSEPSPSPRTPACQSDCSIPQANTPLSTTSNISSPIPQKMRSRKDKGNVRQRHVKDWLDTKRKSLRNLGKEYVSRKGIVKASKEMGPPCQCRMKCSDKLNNEQRKNIFDSFWGLGDRHKQWTYLANLVTKSIKRRTFTDVVSRRKFTLTYKLPIADGEIIDHVSVCKKFFLNTMSISDQVINTALNKVNTDTGTLYSDKRGRHFNHSRKITE